MSELVMTKNRGLVVSEVDPDSPGGRAGFQEQDVIRKVNGKAVNDVVDFRYHTSDEEFEIEFVRHGMYETVRVQREWGEDLGLTFTFELADQIHTCDNKCVFCFIHQMPKGMRKTLYLMDDDFRLSFLHGNYVTLTNMSEEEFERTKQQRLSPLYVSVHATDPKLRGFMLGRPGPEPILPRIEELAESGISVHCQVVLCPGLNDGDALERTITDLAALHPRATGRDAGTLSVAVVPVGLSKYRHNLYPIRRVTSEYSQGVLKRIARRHSELKARLGTRFVFPSDEWFFYAGRQVPGRPWYEDFPQFEDGVGTCRLFLDQSERAYKKLPSRIAKPVAITLVTTRLPSGVIRNVSLRLNEVQNLTADVCIVTNDFFGHGITVAGLITGQDLLKALKAHQPRGIVALPDICLKDGRLFLDDYTLEDIRRESGFDVRAVPSSAKEFLGKWLPSVV